MELKALRLEPDSVGLAGALIIKRVWTIATTSFPVPYGLVNATVPGTLQSVDGPNIHQRVYCPTHEFVLT